MSKKPSFEEKLDDINKEIYKRKNKWTLTAINWMDFEDVSQILRFHLFTKWHLYDPSKPLAPWVNTVISHQIRNLIRNNYSNYSRPCLRCAASEGDNLCSIYGTQCSKCPLYDHWYKNKKKAYDLKLPVSIENHTHEIMEIPQDEINVDRSLNIINKFLEHNLKKFEYEIFKLLYLENKSEDEVASIMHYKTSEKGRKPGYKQIKNIKKTIINKIKLAIKNGDLDITGHG